MSILVSRVYEYALECDQCGFMEVYHTGDSDRGVVVHSVPTAKRAALFHVCKRGDGNKVLCHKCYMEGLQ